MEIDNDIFFSLVKEELSAGRTAKIRVKGYSMLPLLSDKDMVVFAPYKDREPAPGDIVLFRYHGRDLMHRIVSIAGGSRYEIQGDGIWRSYEHCGRESIAGYVSQVVRRDGRVVETDSRAWRLRSRLWRSLGLFRMIPLMFMAAVRKIVIFKI